MPAATAVLRQTTQAAVWVSRLPLTTGSAALPARVLGASPSRHRFSSEKKLRMADQLNLVGAARFLSRELAAHARPGTADGVAHYCCLRVSP